jgi:hypothetical protein
MHVGVGPGVATDGVEILPGPRNAGHWLFEAGDTLVVRISSGQAVIMLTTVRAALLPAIAIEITRLDRKPVTPAEAPAPQPALPLARPAPPFPPAIKTTDGRPALGMRIDLHIQNKGDTAYVNNFWAGALGERLAIEAFSISPLDGLRPEQIEYIAMTETGRETGWINGGQICGAKGAATALTGFAVRVKPGDAGDYECEYRGSFSSGRVVGPLRDGVPCRSEAGDRLEAIQLFILPRTRENAATPTKEPASSQPIGARFSPFREPSQ